MEKDPYSVLGVARDADEATVRDAYRKRAKACHPDLYPDDPHAAQKMNELNEAYEAIRHPAVCTRTARANPYARNASRAQDGRDAWEEMFRQAERQRREARPRGGLRLGWLVLTAILGYLLLSFLSGGCARLLGGADTGRVGGAFAFPLSCQTMPLSGKQED